MVRNGRGWKNPAHDMIQQRIYLRSSFAGRSVEVVTPGRIYELARGFPRPCSFAVGRSRYILLPSDQVRVKLSVGALQSVLVIPVERVNVEETPPASSLLHENSRNVNRTRLNMHDTHTQQSVAAHVFRTADQASPLSVVCTTHRSVLSAGQAVEGCSRGRGRAHRVVPQLLSVLVVQLDGAGALRSWSLNRPAHFPQRQVLLSFRWGAENIAYGQKAQAEHNRSRVAR